MRASSDATSSPTTPAPITSTRSPGSGAASQATFSAVSMLAASTARLRRHVVRDRNAHRRRGQEDVLVRMQHEDSPAVRGSANSAVAVFHREREFAAHQRRAHCGYWLGGTRPANTSASVPRETPLAIVRTAALVRVRGGKRLGADLATPWRHGPERARLRSSARQRRAARATAEYRPAGRHRCRCTDQSKRSTSVSVAVSGNVNAGMPEPINSGAMVTCNRSSAPAARKRDTVMPPPSTNIRRSPRCGQRGEHRRRWSAPCRRAAAAAPAHGRRISPRAHPRRRTAASPGLAEHAIAGVAAGGRCPAPRAPATDLPPRAL